MITVKLVTTWDTACGIAEHSALPVDHANTRLGPLAKLHEGGTHVLCLELAAFGQRGRQHAALLDHGALLVRQQLAFVGVEEQDSRYRQEDEQRVEQEQPGADAGERAARPARRRRETHALPVGAR